MSTRLATQVGRVARSLLAMAIVVVVSGLAYRAHCNLPTAVSVQFIFVVLAALRYGFLQSTAVAITAVICLDFFFIPPIFTLSVQDSQNWISLAAFEAAALLVSGLSAHQRHSAAVGEVQRERTAKLYELSRAILLIDSKQSTQEQLAALIRECMQVQQVDLWLANQAWSSAMEQVPLTDDPAFATYAEERDSDDPAIGTSRRILKIGTTPIGAIVLSGWELDPLLADAVSSLAAVALERARALEKENRAEAARNVEQLRTAVLDGLAHGFKTPLTAIQTASSGLLAIGGLSEVQAELVSIVDEQALLLSQLTTRLLQTAALESKDVRLHRSAFSVLFLFERVLDQWDPLLRSRVTVHAGAEFAPVEVDAQLFELAILQLLDNAAKYAAVDSMIEVNITQQENETRIMVENQGAVIPPEERILIFERFYRGAGALHGPTGTGLGLSIVKKTAEAHGGQTWVEVDANRTRFVFTVAGGKRSPA